MSEFVSVDRINSLKSGIESKTGETYTDLTAGVQALVNGYGQGDGGENYTKLDCVTIPNGIVGGMDYGYENGFSLNIALASIARIKARIKFPDTQHCIWIAGAKPNRGGFTVVNDFLDKSTSGGLLKIVSVNENNVDENGITTYDFNVSSTSTNPAIKIGGWKDATYSQTIAVYSVELYDSAGKILSDILPVTWKNGIVGFYDNANGIFNFNTITLFPFMAGEIV